MFLIRYRTKIELYNIENQHSCSTKGDFVGLAMNDKRFVSFTVRKLMLTLSNYEQSGNCKIIVVQM